jgi:hypothetical protein
MNIQAEWYRTDVQIKIRSLTPDAGFGGDSRYWKGTDATGREVRLAVSAGGIAFGAGSYPDGGLFGTLRVPDDEPLTVTLTAAKAAMRAAGWPITWPEEEG